MIQPLRGWVALAAALLLQACSPLAPTIEDHPLPPHYAADWSSKNGMPFPSAGQWGPGSTCFALKGPICAGGTYNSRWHESIIRVENVTYVTLADAESAWEAQRPSVQPSIMQINRELEWSKPWVSATSDQGEIVGFDCRDSECRSWVWVARKDRTVRGLRVNIICLESDCDNRIPIAGFRNLVEPLRFMT